jgi:hypothetical protein
MLQVILAGTLGTLEQCNLKRRMRTTTTEAPPAAFGKRNAFDVTGSDHDTPWTARFISAIFGCCRISVLDGGVQPAVRGIFDRRKSRG